MPDGINETADPYRADAAHDLKTPLTAFASGTRAPVGKDGFARRRAAGLSAEGTRRLGVPHDVTAPREYPVRSGTACGRNDPGFGFENPCTHQPHHVRRYPKLLRRTVLAVRDAAGLAVGTHHSLANGAPVQPSRTASPAARRAAWDRLWQRLLAPPQVSPEPTPDPPSTAS